MVTNHNNYCCFSILPMREPNHNREPITSHKMDHTPNGHNGKVPNPTHNPTPTSIHIHLSIPNDPGFCMDKNSFRHKDAIHTHIGDNMTNLHKEINYHKRSGGLHLLVHLP